QLFLGAQVDRAEPLAVAAQLFEIFFDLIKRRQFRARLDPGEFGHTLRRDFQHVVDFALDVGEAALGAIHAFFGAGTSFAGARQRFQRNLRGTVGFRHHVFGRCKRVGGDAAGVFGRFDFADQRAALFSKYCRRIVEFGAFGFDLGDAGFDGGDLRGRALLAVLRFATVGAGLRAAWRLISRSVAAWRPRAASASR